MPRRIVVFVVLAAALAALFVRLGFWQLSRLRDRRAHNAEIASSLSSVERPYAELTNDSATLRRTMIAGVPEFDAEFLIIGRSRNGSPGVWIMTPLRVPGSDTRVLVNRGWVYAPDASTIELRAWREPRTTFHGYTLRLPDAERAVSTKGRAIRALDAQGVDSMMATSFRRLIVIATDSGDSAAPARLPLPTLDDGPHLSYAIQWFCFALIAVGGAVVVAKRSRVAT